MGIIWDVRDYCGKRITNMRFDGIWVSLNMLGTAFSNETIPLPSDQPLWIAQAVPMILQARGNAKFVIAGRPAGQNNLHEIPSERKSFFICSRFSFFHANPRSFGFQMFQIDTVGGVLKWGYPQSSSIFLEILPEINHPASYWGTPMIMELQVGDGHMKAHLEARAHQSPCRRYHGGMG